MGRRIEPDSRVISLSGWRCDCSEVVARLDLQKEDGERAGLPARINRTMNSFARFFHPTFSLVAVGD